MALLSRRISHTTRPRDLRLSKQMRLLNHKIPPSQIDLRYKSNRWKYNIQQWLGQTMPHVRAWIHNGVEQPSSLRGVV